MTAIREIHLNDQKLNSFKMFATNRVFTTKYTPFTFIPYFLMNEFSRPANMFFLFIILAQQIDPLDPDKFSTILPLSLVLGFTAVKEIYEDLKRRKMDNKANYALVKVVRDGKLTEIRCRDIKVGDIVRVNNGERFPADLILISSSEPQGMAYLETSNVDGESNLKIRMSNINTTHLVDLESLSTFKAVIKCEPPNERIYNFEGNLTTENECLSLDNSNLLLRGAVLKNTKWIYGIVVYTGHETKIMMNSSETPNKRTKMQKQTDQKYFYIAAGLITICIIGTIANIYHDTQILPKHWYLNPDLPNKVGIKVDWGIKTVVLMFLKYLMLLNTLIPISMSVTLETTKLVMAYLINLDLELYDEESDCRAVARSSNLMEELGQIQCILTDKTGTLTCNEMVLRHLIIDGEIYLDCNTPESKLAELSKQPGNNIDFFLKILASCHTIMIDYSDPENPCYQGSSPDELSMVNVASQLNYKFCKRSSGSIIIDIHGKSIEIEIFAVIEFTSARKRMSIVALLPDNNYYLFCKGADSIILERLESDSAQSENVMKSLKGLEEFASAGLRTLCFAYRKLDKDFALEWLDKWHVALNSVADRQQQIDAVAQEIENNLNFIGATGVEDRLQQGVPETIEILMKANIKIWMLTGDRFETAISTAFLSNLIQASTIQLHLIQNDLESISKSLDNFLGLIAQTPKSNFALVVNGSVVEVILSESFAKSPENEKFCKILARCRTLLCCRLSPLQKSQITNFARKQLDYITLAIGDGGNDVSMIQAANVGVGISGKEGLQASRSADFSIAQFKFLTKLVLVHGSWSLYRLSRVIIYSIYKNFALFFTQFWYSYCTNFSAQTFFEPWMYITWNIIFTCWPPTLIGLTDQYVLATELVENPQLYEFGQKNKFFDDKTFWRSALNAILHSFVIFVFLMILFSEGFLLPSQQVSTAYMYGSIGFAIILSVVGLKLLLFTNYLTLFLALSVLISSGLFYVIVPIIRQFPNSFPNASSLELFSHPVFWSCVFVVPVLVLCRDFLWKYYRRQFCPHPYHIVQELKLTKVVKGAQKEGREANNLVFEGFNRKPRRSRGYSFSQTFGQTRVLHAYGQSPRLTSNLKNEHI